MKTEAQMEQKERLQIAYVQHTPLFTNVIGCSSDASLDIFFVDLYIYICVFVCLRESSYIYI